MARPDWTLFVVAAEAIGARTDNGYFTYERAQEVLGEQLKDAKPSDIMPRIWEITVKEATVSPSVNKDCDCASGEVSPICLTEEDVLNDALGGVGDA